MTEQSLYRLMSWLSPTYPVGSYTYSHGLENAVEQGLISDADSACNWISDILSLGSGIMDLVFVSEAYDAVDLPDRMRHVAELAFTFQPTAEISLESRAQGEAFLKVTTAAWHCDALDMLQKAWAGPYVYPVVVGVAAMGHGIDKIETLVAYAHSFIANLVSALVRLIPLGQTDGQQITALLAADIDEVVQQALTTPLESVSSTTLIADIVSMQHETQYTRLFRS